MCYEIKNYYSSFNPFFLFSHITWWKKGFLIIDSYFYVDHNVRKIMIHIQNKTYLIFYSDNSSDSVAYNKVYINNSKRAIFP